jgi:Aminoglycoside-2''-adenylyltransferase
VPKETDLTSVYGSWEVVTPGAAAQLCAGLDVPWWVCGGWAIEAYAAVRREHSDIDLGVFRRDVSEVINHFAAEYHVWAVSSGALKPIATAGELPEHATQLWIREHSGAPWLLDIQLTDDSDGKWVFKRDPSFVLPLNEATWESRGIRYLKPELVVLFKAKYAAAKDEADLCATLPWLDAAGRHRCADLISRVHPDHPWLAMLS